MNDIVKADNVEIYNLLDHYSNFFTSKEIDILTYLWFGFSINEIATKTRVSEDYISRLLNDKKFTEAVKAGLNKKKEIVYSKMETLSLEAFNKIKEVLEMDIGPDSRNLPEVVKTARWIIEQAVLPSMKAAKKDDEHSAVSRIDKDTVGLIMDEINRENERAPKVSIDSLITNSDAIEGEIIDLSSYYSLVRTKGGLVTDGSLNVLVAYEDDTPDEYVLKLQCHLCGTWLVNLPVHIRNTHKMDLTAYKLHFNLPKSVSLIANETLYEDLREKIEDWKIDERK